MLTRHRRVLLALAALLLGTFLATCGDGAFFVSVNFGTVVGDPTCRAGGGQFDLRDQGGLVVLVVISSDTLILTAGGLPGTCNDITPDAHVQVRGHRDASGIAAQSVQLE